MQLTISALTKQTSIYGLFQVAQRGASFAVIPIYTHYLSPEEFGSLDILYLIVWFIGIVGGSKLDAAFIRYFSEAKARDSVGALLGSSILSLLIFATLFCGLSAAFARPILEFMYSSSKVPLAGMYLALAATWLELAGSLPLTYLRVMQEARTVGTISLCKSLVSTITGLVCVIQLDMGVSGILLGAVVGGLIAAAAGYLRVLREVQPGLTFAYTGLLYRYALPMLPAPLFMYVLNYADRYFLVKYWTLADVGLYAMAYKFAMLVNLAVMAPFGEMWGANQFALHSAGHRDTYRRVALLYVSAVYITALCVVYAACEITLLTFDERFHSLLQLVPLLAVGTAIWGLVPTMDLGCMVRNKTWIRSITTAIAAGANVLLNILLIPPMGVVGAALSTALSFVVLAITTYLFNRSLTDYCVDIRKAALLSLALAFLASLTYAREFLPYPVFTALRICALLSFAYLLLRINGITMRDIRTNFVKWRTVTVLGKE